MALPLQVSLCMIWTWILRGTSHKFSRKQDETLRIFATWNRRLYLWRKLVRELQLCLIKQLTGWVSHLFEQSAGKFKTLILEIVNYKHRFGHASCFIELNGISPVISHVCWSASRICIFSLQRSRVRFFKPRHVKTQGVWFLLAFCDTEGPKPLVLRDM